MAVPDFQTLMLPLLALASDGEEHTSTEAGTALATEFRLTEDDLTELLPSGKQTRFQNRIGWALVHLRKARLLESTGRGRFCITQRGKEVLHGKPTAITLKTLDEFPEHRDWFRNASRESPRTPTSPPEDSLTPLETLAIAYQTLRESLATDLLERALACPPTFFERLVVDLLLAMGYGGSRADAGRAIGRSGDGGVDGIINEDRLGLDVVYIQAKRWEGTVSRPQVQAFAGALEGQRASKGVFITTSQFSREAIDFVTRIQKRIVLIDGNQLAQLMVDHGIGVTPVETYTVNKVDLDYFEES